MPAKTQTYTVYAYWRGNHWELRMHGTGTLYLTRFLNTIGQHPTNPTYHIRYPQADQPESTQ